MIDLDTDTCAGGWCHVRTRCVYYQPGKGRPPTHERLCPPGMTLQYFKPQKDEAPAIPVPEAAAHE